MKFAVCVMLLGLLVSCSSSKDSKWGREFDLSKKWWQQPGQFYDTKDKIFMAVGMSKGTYQGNLRLERDSADLDARKQAANFMQSLVSSYVKECYNNGINADENIVKGVSEEVLIGSAIIDRYYDESKKIYYSLLKIDLGYFFKDVKTKLVEDLAKKGVIKGTDLDPSKPKTQSSDITQKLESIEKKLDTTILNSTNKTN